MKICEAGRDSCGCKEFTKGIRTINGQYPDDNRDFDINAGNGIRIEPATGGITIINDSAASSFVEGDNIEITPSGDDLIIGLVSDPQISGNLEVSGTTTLNDTLQVNADIIQNGSAYETHAEKVYTTNDYIITREGAVSALSAGDYSGFQVKKYDGTNDGRLVIDNTGVARVGDVGDEQPLLTREESANLNNGALLKWDAPNMKAVDEGTVGSDDQPIKIVNGVATAISDDYMQVFSTFRTDWGDHVAIKGFMQYRRTSKKKGILSGSIYVSATGVTGDYYLTTINAIASHFGLNFKTPSSNTQTGWYMPISSGGNVNIVTMGSGAPVRLTNDGKFVLGRYYTDNGDYGGWDSANFSEHNIVFGDVLIEEV